MNKPKEPEIEILGAAIRSFYEGLGSFTSLATKYLLQHGIGKPGPNKQAILELDGWYPRESVLGVYQAINQEIGEGPIFKAGCSIPKYAVWPPSITDVYAALHSIDVAYHMNNRRDGVVMFNPETGQMLEGIGHYLYQPGQTKNTATLICDDPFPCALDRGILTATIERYQPRVVIKHGPNCRKQGATSCTYNASW